MKLITKNNHLSPCAKEKRELKLYLFAEELQDPSSMRQISPSIDGPGCKNWIM
jgi:hypothetical protein